MTVKLFIVICLSLSPLAANEVLAAGYRAERSFAFPEFASLTGACTGLVVLWFGSPTMGVLAAAYGFLVRVLTELAFLAIFKRPHYFCFASLRLATVLRQVQFLVLGACVHRTDTLFDRYLTSFAAPGALSLLAVSRQMIHTASRLMTRSITWTCIPTLSQNASKFQWNAFSATLNARSLAILGVGLLGIVLLAGPGPYLLPILFQHGEVTSEDTRFILQILFCLTGTLVGESLANLFSNAFYSMGNTSLPTRIHIVVYIIGLLIRVICFYKYGVIGIAAGLSLYYLLYASLLYWLLRRSLRSQKGANIESRET